MRADRGRNDLPQRFQLAFLLPDVSAGSTPRPTRYRKKASGQAIDLSGLSLTGAPLCPEQERQRPIDQMRRSLTGIDLPVAQGELPHRGTGTQIEPRKVDPENRGNERGFVVVNALLLV